MFGKFLLMQVPPKQLCGLIIKYLYCLVLIRSCEMLLHVLTDPIQIPPQWHLLIRFETL